MTLLLLSGKTGYFDATKTKNMSTETEKLAAKIAIEICRYAYPEFGTGLSDDLVTLLKHRDLISALIAADLAPLEKALTVANSSVLTLQRNIGTERDTVASLRAANAKLVEELASETKWAKEYLDRAETAEAQLASARKDSERTLPTLDACLADADRALTKAGHDEAANSVYAGLMFLRSKRTFGAIDSAREGKAP